MHHRASTDGGTSDVTVTPDTGSVVGSASQMRTVVCLYICYTPPPSQQSLLHTLTPHSNHSSTPSHLTLITPPHPHMLTPPPHPHMLTPVTPPHPHMLTPVTPPHPHMLTPITPAQPILFVSAPPPPQKAPTPILNNQFNLPQLLREGSVFLLPHHCTTQLDLPPGFWDNRGVPLTPQLVQQIQSDLDW